MDIFCETCNREFKTNKTLHKHYSSKIHKDKKEKNQNQDMMNKLDEYIKTLPNDITTCFNNSVIQIKSILNKDDGYKDNFEDILSNITSFIHNPIKLYLSEEIEYKKGETKFIMGHTTIPQVYTAGIYISHLNEIEKLLNEAELRESGWMIQRRISRTLHISYYNSAGGSYIELPFKSPYINIVKNMDDDMCIIWSLVAYMFPATKDKQRISKYLDHLNSIILPSFDFPYNHNNIKKLHKLNNVDFNIFAIDEDKRIKGIKFRSHNNYKGCNLLLYKNHYVLCTNISTIIRNSNRMSYPCLNCLTSYSSEQILENH